MLFTSWLMSFFAEILIIQQFLIIYFINAEYFLSKETHAIYLDIILIKLILTTNIFAPSKQSTKICRSYSSLSFKSILEGEPNQPNKLASKERVSHIVIGYPKQHTNLFVFQEYFQRLSTINNFMYYKPLENFNFKKHNSLQETPSKRILFKNQK